MNQKLQAWIETVLARLALIHEEVLPALTFKSPFELLVSTILSAQCTDARVNLVTPALFARFPDPASLSVAARDSRTLAELETLIHSTGFFRAKARNLASLGDQLVKKHGGKVPETMEELVELPGVGRKTAGVILSVCYNIPAIIVDTHFGRVARRLGLAVATDPAKLEKEIADLLPQRHWVECGRLLNLHGRKICLARSPRCELCPLAYGCPSRVLP
ncbi:MAG: endonuclease III [Treponemataceae bacterium]